MVCAQDAVREQRVDVQWRRTAASERAASANQLGQMPAAARARRKHRRRTHDIPPTDRELIRHAECGLGLLQGKWKVHLLVLLARGIHRHSEFLAHMPGVSKKVVTETLRALERDGLIVRHVAAGPGRVGYSLTPMGWSAAEPLVSLADWFASATGGTEAAGA